MRDTFQLFKFLCVFEVTAVFCIRACFLILVTAAMLSACGGGDVQNPAVTDTSQSGFEPKLPVPRAAAELTQVSTSSALASQAVNLQDAIAILKMIVGLEVNGSGQSVTAYQAYAADVDGNGKVALTDAITVLKRVVGEGRLGWTRARQIVTMADNSLSSKANISVHLAAG